MRYSMERRVGESRISEWVDAWSGVPPRSRGHTFGGNTYPVRKSHCVGADVRILREGGKRYFRERRRLGEVPLPHPLNPPIQRCTYILETGCAPIAYSVLAPLTFILAWISSINFVLVPDHPS